LATRFESKEYQDAVRGALDAGYSVDDIARVRPGWSRQAIIGEFSGWYKPKTGQAELSRSKKSEIADWLRTNVSRTREDYLFDVDEHTGWDLGAALRAAEKVFVEEG